MVFNELFPIVYKLTSFFLFGFDIFFTVKNYGPWIKFLISQLDQVSFKLNSE